MKTEMYEDFSDVISRACEEPTLHAAFAWIATWERDVCIENVRANSSWEHDRGSMASIFDMVHASYVHGSVMYA